MSHAFLFVPAAGQTEAPSFEKGVRALGDFKGVQITDSATSATASLAVAPSAKATQITKGRIARSEDGPKAQVWIADLGLWLPLPAERGRDAAWLIEQYLAHGAEGLARRLFQRFAPPLARIPLEHGYPPVPASPFNLWRFSPLLSYYGGKVINKVAAKLGMARKPAAPTARPDDTALMRDTGIAEWRQSPLILQSGLFNEQALRNLLDNSSMTSGPRVEQWRRLMTLEAVLRYGAYVSRAPAS